MIKHAAQIQSEFIKEARNWDDLSLEDQKGYLSRHPASKRKITARPGTAKKKDDTKKTRKKLKEKTKKLDKSKTKEKTTKGTGSYAEFVAKLTNKSLDDIKNEIAKLQAKVDKREQAATRREQRAHGDLDGTSYEAAFEKSRPDIMRKKLLEHYLEHSTKKLPKELQDELDEYNEIQKSKQERKEERVGEVEKHSHLMGKTITWRSKKNFGQEMSARVIAVKGNKWGGAYVKTDSGWKIPVSMIEKSKAPSKEEKGKVQVKASELIGKEVRWKSKHRAAMRPSRRPRPAPPSWDSTTGTAGGIVDGAKGSKVTIKGWRIPIALITQVDGKEFSGWK